MATSTTPATGLKAFNDFIRLPKTQNYLTDVLSEKKSQFVNNLVALVTNSDNLQQCEPMTVMNAAIKATALNLPLDPNLGFAYIVPFWDRKANKRNAQFQIGYKGLLQLAIRSGQMQKINVTDIREGELIDEDLLTGDITIRRAPDRESKKIIGFCAYMKLANGFEKTLYSTREDIEKFAMRFTQQKTKDGKLANIWSSDFDAMAKKTILKALLKFAPLSTEMENAMVSDTITEQLTQSQPPENYEDADVIISVEESEPTPTPTQTPTDDQNREPEF